jgi:hypothetical protein
MYKMAPAGSNVGKDAALSRAGAARDKKDLA